MLGAQPCSLWPPKGMGGGKEFQERETCVQLWLIHVTVWQKPSQYCETIILQLKINKKFLKTAFKKGNF